MKKLMHFYENIVWYAKESAIPYKVLFKLKKEWEQLDNELREKVTSCFIHNNPVTRTPTKRSCGSDFDTPCSQTEESENGVR